jgi:hypothetical protein
MLAPPFIGRLRAGLAHLRGFDSGDYWRDRYRLGGDSGRGSYGDRAAFKAATLNSFIEAQGIDRCLEFGSGDGHQASLLRIAEYLGLDIAPEAVLIAENRCAGDPSRRFAVYAPDAYDPALGPTAPLTISMDVILHLVEDEVYERYMRNLFAASTRFVAIYSTATDRQPRMRGRHVRFRDHRPWIAHNRPDASSASEVLCPVELGLPDPSGFWFYRLD